MNERSDTPNEAPELAPTSAPAESVSEELQDGPSAGELLSQARQAHNLSLQQLAAQTRIKQHILEQLESDEDPEDLAPVFVRGHYRRCAKILGIAEADIVQAYERRAGSMQPAQTEPVEWVSVVRPPSRVPFPGGAWALLAAVAVFVIIIVGVALLRESGGIPDLQAAATASVDDTVSDSAARTRKQPSEPSASEVHTAAAQPAPRTAAAEPVPDSGSTEPTQASTPAAVSQNAATPASATQPAAGTTLVLQAQENCWVSVHDANNKRLMQGIIPAGHKRTLQGQPPYQVVLGNARGMRVSYAGKVVDISGKVSAGSNTARFSIPLASR